MWPSAENQAANDIFFLLEATIAKCKPWIGAPTRNLECLKFIKEMSGDPFIAATKKNWAKEKCWTNNKSSQTSEMTVKASDKPFKAII